MIRNFVALLLASLFSFHCHATSVELLGRQISLVIPSGYCSIIGDPVFAEWERRIREIGGNSNVLLELFANCSDMQDFRAGRQRTLVDYGMILAQSPGGQVRAAVGISRAKYIANMMGGKDPTEALQKAMIRASKFVSGYSAESLGMLGADGNGAYAGALLTLRDDPNRSITVLCVAGLTLVKELPVSINLYVPFSTSQGLPLLLDRQKFALGRLVRANN